MFELRRVLLWRRLASLPLLAGSLGLFSVGCIVIQSGSGDPCSSGGMHSDPSMSHNCGQPGDSGSGSTEPGSTGQPDQPTSTEPAPPPAEPTPRPTDPNGATPPPTTTDPGPAPGTTPPPQPPPTSSSDCLDDCESYAAGVFTECMILLGDQATCQEHASLAMASCQYGCDIDDGSTSEPPPPKPEPTPVPPNDSDCQTQCQTQADQMLNECMASGNDPAACKERYQAVLESCLSTCP